MLAMDSSMCSPAKPSETTALTLTPMASGAYSRTSKPKKRRHKLSYLTVPKDPPAMSVNSATHMPLPLLSWAITRKVEPMSAAPPPDPPALRGEPDVWQQLPLTPRRLNARYS